MKVSLRPQRYVRRPALNRREGPLGGPTEATGVRKWHIELLVLHRHHAKE
jgi:hypothetical protein